MKTSIPDRSAKAIEFIGASIQTASSTEEAKCRTGLSIVVSSLVFGVLHIAYGLPYMLGAALLLGVMGVLYHKQGNIWGLCIIHYVLGEVATFLRYLI